MGSNNINSNNLSAYPEPIRLGAIKEIKLRLEGIKNYVDFLLPEQKEEIIYHLKEIEKNIEKD